MANHVLSEMHNGKRLTARVGDTVVVRLHERSGGGYRWSKPQSDEVVRVIEQRHEPQSDAVGAAGTSVWTLQLVQPGTTRFELTQSRPWESGVAPADRFAVDLVVR